MAENPLHCAWNPVEKWLTTTETAARLGVKPATVYAYVSRGLLQNERVPDGRGSRFDAAEVERLASRNRTPARGSSNEFIIESSITAIEGDRLYFRGLDALSLARTRTFEEVAEWLWTGEMASRSVWRADAVAIVAGVGAQTSLPAGTLPGDRLRVVVAATAPTDDLRFDTRRDAVVVTARSLIAALVDCLPRLRSEPMDPLVIGGAAAPTGLLAARLWARLTPVPVAPGVLEILNAALVLLADHQINPSTLAARAAASVRADPYAVVGTGLGVLSAPLHVGASLTAETFLAEIEEPSQARRVVGDRLRSHQNVPGFGHNAYAGPDPRALLLLDMLHAAAPDDPRLAGAEAVVTAMQERGLSEVNVDFALAALARVAGFIRGSSEVVFAVARTVGWIAHAIEQYPRGSSISARAVYTGVTPGQAGAESPRPVHSNGLGPQQLKQP